jgi:MoaA/NifB/PqqE/SkfB family radical SAM enzyme
MQIGEIAPFCVFFSWYLNNECNYQCSFCKPQDIKTVFATTDKWIQIWDGLYERYGACHLHISGGEPFIYPNFIELISRLSQKHTLEFSTNLSMDIQPFIDNISPHRARLGGSFHPEFSQFERFFKKILLLKDKGFEVWVNYVAYPSHLPEMGKYKRLVEEQGIRFSIQPFNGTFSGREYPRQYTDEEKMLMADGGLDDVNKETIDWRTDGAKSSIKGKLCRMGQVYARIYPNAEVYRCCGNGALRLGNLLDGSFRLLEEPLACECDNCPCWRCMMVGKEEYWMQYWTTPERENLRKHGIQ